MATIMTQRVPFSSDQYDQVNQELDIENNPPDGIIHHFAAKTDDGMLIFDVWESRDHFERFQNERLMPAVMKVAGGEMPPGGPPETTFAELHNEFHK